MFHRRPTWGVAAALAGCRFADVAPLTPPETPVVAKEIAAPPTEPAKTETTTEAKPEEPELLDTWSLAEREDGAACRAALKDAGFKFSAYPDVKQRDKSGCGMPHGVIVFRGPTGIVYEPAISIDCSLARALGAVERIVQDEAARHLGSPIAKVGTLGGYACRPRNFRRGATLSAHAFGSAVDIALFQPQKGMPAVVLQDYPEMEKQPPGREGRHRFLRAAFARLRSGESDLTYAIGPDFNAIHKNHFHLDRGGWWFWTHRDVAPP